MSERTIGDQNEVECPACGEGICKRALRQLGYLKVDYGFSCGRHWISIDAKIIAQTSGNDVWMRDADVHRLGYAVIDHGKHWVKPTQSGE